MTATLVRLSRVRDTTRYVQFGEALADVGDVAFAAESTQTTNKAAVHEVVRKHLPPFAGSSQCD